MLFINDDNITLLNQACNNVWLTHAINDPFRWIGNDNNFDVVLCWFSV